MPVAAARLEHQHAVSAVPRQPIGEYAASGTGTQEDAVVILHDPFSAGVEA
ncbi:MAG: hypothetical protein ACT4UQ_07730 [Gammaproteobacteria bacterium]